LYLLSTKPYEKIIFINSGEFEKKWFFTLPSLSLNLIPEKTKTSVFFINLQSFNSNPTSLFYFPILIYHKK